MNFEGPGRGRHSKGGINHSLFFCSRAWVELEALESHNNCDLMMQWWGHKWGSPFPPLCLPQSWAEEPEGKIHLPGHSHNIHLTQLLVKFNTSTKGWVACGQLEMPPPLPPFSGGWPTAPQALSSIEMMAIFGESFLSFSVAGSSYTSCERVILNHFGVQCNDLSLQRAILTLKQN